MKYKEYVKSLKSKDVKSLYSQLQKEHKNLYKYRFSTKFRNLKDTSMILKTKKNIARIYSILSQKIQQNNK